MKKWNLIIITAVLLGCFLPYSLYAGEQKYEFMPDSLSMVEQQQVAEVTTVAPQNLRYGVGFQGTFPAWGISGTIGITDDITGQLILGPFGFLQTYAGRGLYQFREEPYWEMYGFGMLGVWTYNYGFNRRNTETSLGIGAGAGIQYDWRVLDDQLPPIFWNLELGLGFVNFDNYNFGNILIGTGVHYRF